MNNKSKFAKEYAENHVIVNHLTPEEYENTDAAIYNLQFMSFCKGYEKAIDVLMARIRDRSTVDVIYAYKKDGITKAKCDEFILIDELEVLAKEVVG